VGTMHKLRVLYSFPHKIGADRICYLAWQMVVSLYKAGVDVTVIAGAIKKPLPEGITVKTTLSLKKMSLPYRLIGTYRACVLHDWIVSQRIAKFTGKIDLLHVWPLGCLRTLKVAKKLNIPTVLERCNAHTGYAYTVVKKECDKLGFSLPPDHEHAYKEKFLKREQLEYDLATSILCPSNFVLRTFVDKGFDRDKLSLYGYGFDENRCYPADKNWNDNNGLTVLFAAGCAPRKGLHYALEAWVRSPASQNGTFLVVGEFVPGYAEKLSNLLKHKSVKILGYRKDLPDIMRQSDVLVLPSIEEGSALVTWDAIGCGCVLVVSDATGAYCEHMKNALIHKAGNVEELSSHITMLDKDRDLLRRLRTNLLEQRDELTWGKSGFRLIKAYESILAKA
jgi:glycosyltransferase involved in cell wall biosynthesis